MRSITWSGEIVASGYVEVTADVNGQPFPLPAISNDIVVQPRNWSALSAQSTVALVPPTQLSLTPKDSVGSLGRTRTFPFESPLTQITDNGPNHGFAYYSTMPMRVRHDIQINPSMSPGQPFYNNQDPVMGRLKSAKHGAGKFRWCWQSRMPPFQGVIEAHEGTQQETWSHVGVFNRVMDSLLRVEAERVTTTTGAPPVDFMESIARRAHTADSLYDYDQQHNVFRVDGAQQVIFQAVFPQDTLRCRPRYF